MLFQFICISTLLINSVTSAKNTGSKWRSMKNEEIRVPDYCNRHGKKCIIKCCPPDQHIETRDGITKCVQAIDEVMKNKLQFSSIDVYKNISTKGGKSLNNAFVLVQNDDFHNLSFTYNTVGELYILETATLEAKNGNSVLSKGYLNFCIDYKIKYANGTSRVLFSVRRTKSEWSTPTDYRFLLVVIGHGVTIFFCMLVLIIYGLLTKLQTLGGLIKMAYLATFVVANVLKATQLLVYNAGKNSPQFCLNFIPVLHYAILVSFFWLNCMSIDMWRLITKLNRTYTRPGQIGPGKWKRFLKYCYYTFLAPLAIIIACGIVERLDLIKDNKLRPPYKSCFLIEPSVQLYVSMPIGILTIANTVLFAITAYTVWATKGDLYSASAKNSGNTAQNQSRFLTCLKIFVLAGVTWVLELFPSDLPLPIFIAINFYNMFIGVAIFYILVCNKKILLALCKRFNINNDFVKRLQTPDTALSTFKTTANASEKKPSVENDQSTEALTID